MRKTVGGVLLVVAAVVVGGMFARKPWIVYNEQRASAAQRQAEMRESERRRADLLRREARVRSSVGQEELARTHGFVEPGEEPADK